MADPLSVTGSAVGIVSWGLTVLQGLIDYCNALKDQDDDIQSVNTQLHRLHKVFADVESRIKETKNTLPPSKLGDLESTLKECFTEVKELEGKLETIRALDAPKGVRAKTKARLKRFCYPFDGKGTLLKIKEIAGGLNGHIMAAMNVLQIDVALETDTKIDVVSEGVANVQSNLQNFHITFETAEIDRYLEKLPRVQGAAFDSYLVNRRPSCLKGTRVDLLKEIMEWCRSSATSDRQCIYWLSGMAGMGKSTIALTVSKTCDEEKRLGASFFFSIKEERLRKARNFVASIAFQLTEHIFSLKPLVSEAIKKNPDVFEKSLKIQWKHLISDPLDRLNKPMLEGFVVVVDALDECMEEDIELILGVLALASELRTTRLKIFVTSRPETSIRKVFEGSDSKMTLYQRQEMHDVPQNTIDRDIETYFRDQLKEEIEAEVITPENLAHLVKRAGGLFIWATTACQFIKRARAMKQSRIKLLLGNEKSSQNPEEDLDRIYTAILLSTIKDKYDEREYDHVFGRYRRIVGAIILVSSPVSMDILSGILNLPENEIIDIIGDLHSVLNIPANGPIRTLHLSFSDFLLSENRCGDTYLRINEPEGHRSLLIDCLRCMSEPGKLEEDMCNLGYPGFSSGNVKKDTIEKALPSDLQYACRYWIYHRLRSGTTLTTRDDSDIEIFLQNHFLHWLEALSLMGIVCEGIDAIRALESKVLSDGTDRLYKLIHDARRFITKHRKTIENNPLQIYSSALVFSPTSSIIRQQFTRKIPTWIKTPPLIQECWDPLLQILESHSGQILTLAFSPDGKLLASGHDSTVRLWDPATGALLQTLEGHSGPVWALAFSPDGKLLASGSHDSTVRLWDPTTRVLLQTLEGHSGSANTLAFSPDGKLLASGSHDGTVRLWEPATGALLQTLEGHSHSVNIVTFSSDGKFLASGSYDTVRLWNPATRALQQTLEGHSGKAWTLAFSPYGKLLASGSHDRTIRLWNPATGALLHTLEGHSGPVRTLEFSPDGKLLASGSHDGTVRLWDPATEALLQTLEGYSGSVNALAFASDGRTLTTYRLSNDPTYLWGIRESWVTHGQYNMLFLPFDVQPYIHAAYGNFLAWADHSAKVHIMQMDSSQLPDRLSR